MSLANKYRPREFTDVCGQSSIIKILDRQLSLRTFKNCYLFTGPSGTGKTTLARIFASKINNGKGDPIEIDGASNNGVDNVRQICEQANERSLDSEYKFYIIDECHALSNSAWQAFLKTIEEPPKYTIFIFCTTDPQKVPDTIKNRCMEFSLGRINVSDIKSRLISICNSEGYSATSDGLEYLARRSGGSMRQAISFLDKCKDYSTDITVDNACKALGKYSYDVLFGLINARIDSDSAKIINIIEDLDRDGVQLDKFLDVYLHFILDLNKYCIFESIGVTDIPGSYIKEVEYTTNVDKKFFRVYLDRVLEIKQAIKGDTMIKTTIEAMLLP